MIPQLDCSAAIQQLDRVTALHDEFTKTAQEEEA